MSHVSLALSGTILSFESRRSHDKVTIRVKTGDDDISFCQQAFVPVMRDSNSQPSSIDAGKHVRLPSAAAVRNTERLPILSSEDSCFINILPPGYTQNLNVHARPSTLTDSHAHTHLGAPQPGCGQGASQEAQGTQGTKIGKRCQNVGSKGGCGEPCPGRCNSPEISAAPFSPLSPALETPEPFLQTVRRRLPWPEGSFLSDLPEAQIGLEASKLIGRKKEVDPHPGGRPCPGLQPYRGPGPCYKSHAGACGMCGVCGTCGVCEACVAVAARASATRASTRESCVSQTTSASAVSLRENMRESVRLVGQKLRKRVSAARHTLHRLRALTAMTRQHCTLNDPHTHAHTQP